MDVRKVLNALDKRNFKGFCVKDETELIALLDRLIPEHSVVGASDSVTLQETGVLDFLRSGNYHFLDKHREGIGPAEKKQLYLQYFSADTFLCSTNALTKDGVLYNIDGSGNRMAPVIYGPRQVIIVAGINKLVRNGRQAKRRVRHHAAPRDAKRLSCDTPCVDLGRCTDCDSPDRICNVFTAITGQLIKDRIKVILVGKSLGY
jgi:hypothetical protein